MNFEFPIQRTTGLKIEHCCLDRGVKLKVYLESPITEMQILKLKENTEIISNLYCYSNSETGFYRFTLSGSITISGVIKKDYLIALYSFLTIRKNHEYIESLFPGFQNEWLAKKNNIRVVGD